MLGGAGWQLVTDVNDVNFFGQNNAFFREPRAKI
jgi:hypothetical protein